MNFSYHAGKFLLAPSMILHVIVVFTVYGICTARGLYVLLRVEPEEVRTALVQYYPMHCKIHDTADLY